MPSRCMFCKHFDDTTGVATCTLLCKFTRAEWSCPYFASRDDA